MLGQTYVAAEPFRLPKVVILSSRTTLPRIRQYYGPQLRTPGTVELGRRGPDLFQQARIIHAPKNRSVDENIW
jgi:hypothetical protein